LDRSAASHSIRETLGSRGIRLTRPRRVIWDVLEQAGGHLHAGQILEGARRADARIDRSTVYRTIALLKRHGMVDELDLLHLDGIEHFYELRRPRGHLHVGCPSCGRIVEMQTGLIGQLEAEIKRQTGFVVNSVRIEVAACCPRCRKQFPPERR
jgi:Fur family ferric uptake transcriptional regulator